MNWQALMQSAAWCRPLDGSPWSWPRWLDQGALGSQFARRSRPLLFNDRSFLNRAFPARSKLPCGFLPAKFGGGEHALVLGGWLLVLGPPLGLPSLYRLIALLGHFPEAVSENFAVLEELLALPIFQSTELSTVLIQSAIANLAGAFRQSEATCRFHAIISTFYWNWSICV